MKPVMALAATALLATAAFAQDVTGSADPLGVPRYPGARIIHAAAPSYSQYRLDLDAGWHKTKTVEGQWGRVVYLIPGAATSLQVFRDYQRRLASAGLKKQFEMDAPSTIDSYFFDQFFFGPEKYDPSNPSSLYNLVNNAAHPYYAIYKGEVGGKAVTVTLLSGQAQAMTYAEPGESLAVSAGAAFVAIDTVTS